MAMIASIFFFALFAADVVLGAFWGKVFLGDVGEMLVMMAASACFAVGILKKESDRKSQKGD